MIHVGDTFEEYGMIWGYWDVWRCALSPNPSLSALKRTHNKTGTSSRWHMQMITEKAHMIYVASGGLRPVLAASGRVTVLCGYLLVMASSATYGADGETACYVRRRASNSMQSVRKSRRCLHVASAACRMWTRTVSYFRRFRLGTAFGCSGCNHAQLA
jgi:hypothetical protein